MSIHKKKRTCPKSGKTKTSKNYFLKHRSEDDDRPIEISLRTSNRRIAEDKARKYIQAEERKRSGLYVTEQQRTNGTKNLHDLKDSYIQYLVSKGTQRDHFRKVNQRLTDGLIDLKWNSLNSFDKQQYHKWIQSQHQWSTKTQSHYQTAFKAFSKWLFEEDYLPEDPLNYLRSIQGVSSSAPPIAALTADESRTFLAACPQYRQDFYSLMIYTGLRAIEVNRLRVGSIHIDEDGRYWAALNRDESKARRKEILEIPSQLKPTVLRLTKSRNKSAKLLPKGRPSRRTFNLDLQRAQITKERFDGSCITLHSLRKTFVTLVSGVSESPAATQRLARHMSSELTEMRYTDKKALNHHDILDKLPCLLPLGTDNPSRPHRPSR